MPFPGFFQSQLHDYADYSQYYDAIADIKLWNNKTVGHIFRKVEPELRREKERNLKEWEKVRRVHEDWRTGKLKGSFNVHGDVRHNAYWKYVNPLVWIVFHIQLAKGERCPHNFHLEEHREALEKISPVVEFLRNHKYHRDATAALPPLERIKNQIKDYLADFEHPSEQKIKIRKSRAGVDNGLILTIIQDFVSLARLLYGIDRGHELTIEDSFEMRLRESHGLSLCALTEHAVTALLIQCGVPLKKTSIRYQMEQYPEYLTATTVLRTGTPVPFIFNE